MNHPDKSGQRKDKPRPVPSRTTPGFSGDRGTPHGLKGDKYISFRCVVGFIRFFRDVIEPEVDVYMYLPPFPPLSSWGRGD